MKKNLFIIIGIALLIIGSLVLTTQTDFLGGALRRTNTKTTASKKISVKQKPAKQQAKKEAAPMKKVALTESPAANESVFSATSTIPMVISAEAGTTSEYKHVSVIPDEQLYRLSQHYMQSGDDHQKIIDLLNQILVVASRPVVYKEEAPPPPPPAPVQEEPAPVVQPNLIAYYAFDDAADIGKDFSNNRNPGIPVGNPAIYNAGKKGKALIFDGVDDSVAIFLPANVASAGGVVTVSMWMLWQGGGGGPMPFGFDRYDLIMTPNSFGFNTGVSDIYGIQIDQQHINQWMHVVAEFHTEATLENKLYINGIPQTLAQQIDDRPNTNPPLTTNAYISGWGAALDHKFNGIIDEVKIFDRSLTQEEIDQLYQES